MRLIYDNIIINLMINIEEKHLYENDVKSIA